MNKFSLSIVLLLSFSLPAKAAWYEVTGQAVIERNDMTSAREAAINDALKRAALFSGASFRASEKLVNGILQQEHYSLDSHSEIQQVQLLSETRSNNMLSVTLRAEILPQQRLCEGNKYRKSMLLSPFSLQPRQDAIHGNLFSLAQDATLRLDKQLKDYSPAALASVAATRIEAGQLNQAVAEKLFFQGNQYLLTAQITDLSLGEKTNSFWQEATKERFFAIDVTLYDLFAQQIIYQQEYRTNAPWPYKAKQTPQSHSQAFWNMAYGRKIDTILHAIAEDVQQQLRCQPLISQVSQVNHQQVTFSLGSAQGLRTGETVDIVQLQRHPTAEGVTLLKSPIRLTIQSVGPHSSVAIAQQQQLLSHIRQGDLITIAAY